MPRLRRLLAAALLFSPVACAKKMSATAPPMAYGESAAYPVDDGEVAAEADADESYEYRNDSAKRGMMPTAGIEPTPSRDAAGTELAAPAAPPARQNAPAPEPTKASAKTTAGPGDDETEPPKQFARQIIYTAELTISCFKLDEAMQRAEALTLETGGYVQTMSEGYFVLRIPAARLREVMSELAKLGVVESRSLQAQDVTQEYVDVSTRIRVLRETQAQLIALLKQARNVEEALQVRRSLDAVTMELEQALGRLRMLENLIGFSTLTLRLSERGPQNALPSSNDPFPWVDTLGVEATEWN